MEYQVQAYIDTFHNLFYTSGIWTGLCSLADRGVIDLDFVRPFTRHTLAADQLSVCLTIRAKGAARSLLVAIELRDRPDTFTMDILRRCDVYLKRNYFTPAVEKLPPDLRRKVHPFGLNHACRTPSSRAAIARTAWRQLAVRGLLSPLRTLRWLWQERDEYKQYWFTPGVDHFEQPPDTHVEQAVLFQTRIWEPGGSDPEKTARINDERVAMVRAMRKAFGQRFWGGLVPTALARERYPDLVTANPTRRWKYIAMSKRVLVGIYTRGLHDSLAIKMSEYLAASTCVVSEPLLFRLPEPLVAGKHYLLFQNAEECVERCAELLRSPERARAMREENHRYYLNEVEPAAHMLNCLNRSWCLGQLGAQDTASAERSAPVIDQSLIGGDRSGCNQAEVFQNA
jgi:hypothetical protein